MQQSGSVWSLYNKKCFIDRWHKQKGFIFSQFWRYKSQRSRLWQNSAFSESSSPDLQTAAFSLCPHIVESHFSGDSASFLRTQVLLDQGPTLITSCSLTHLLKDSIFFNTESRLIIFFELKIEKLYRVSKNKTTS